MEKSLRLKKIDDFLSEGKNHDEIIKLMLEESGVAEATLKNNILEVERFNKELKEEEEVEEEEEEEIIDIDGDGDEDVEVFIIEVPGEGKKKFAVDKNEMENTAHIYQEKVNFDPNTGKKLSRGSVQKYDERSWNNFRQYGKSLGYNTIIPIHIPKKWKKDVLDVPSIGKKTPQR